MTISSLASSGSLCEEVIACDALPARDQRTVVFYMLYVADAFGYTMNFEDIAAQFGQGFSCYIDHQGSIFERAQAITLARTELDEEIRPLLQNWRLERLSVATRLIVRMGVWELKTTALDIPVVINEALELAKSFSEPDAYKFVNGVLDEWLRRNKPESYPVISVEPLLEDNIHSTTP